MRVIFLSLVSTGQFRPADMWGSTIYMASFAKHVVQLPEGVLHLLAFQEVVLDAGGVAGERRDRDKTREPVAFRRDWVRICPQVQSRCTAFMESSGLGWVRPTSC